MIKIEKGLPMPRPNKRHGGVRRYPWQEMEVGDSFFVPREGTSQKAIQALSCVTSKRWAPKRWATRTMPGGFRVWRTA